MVARVARALAATQGLVCVRGHGAGGLDARGCFRARSGGRDHYNRPIKFAPVMHRASALIFASSCQRLRFLFGFPVGGSRICRPLGSEEFGVGFLNPSYVSEGHSIPMSNEFASGLRGKHTISRIQADQAFKPRKCKAWLCDGGPRTTTTWTGNLGFG